MYAAARTDVMRASALEFPFLDMRYPCTVKFRGRTFPSAENAYQSARFADPSASEKFRYMTPDTAAYMGASMRTTVKNWNDMREQVLQEVLASKFSSASMRDMLKAMPPVPITLGNIRHENDLGTCLCSRCRGRGKDLAGKILTEMRASL